MLAVLALLLQAQAAVPDSALVVEGRGAPAVAVPRVEEAAVTIDGRLDEPVWESAVRLTGFSQYQPVDGRPAEERTEVRVWYSPTAIHFGILAFDRNPRGIRATVADRDNISSDDRVTIYLDTFDDRRRAFFFGVNPYGVQDDGVRSEGASGAGNLFGGNLDRSPDYLWQSRGRITDRGYEVEVRIPFKSLRYPGGDGQRWGINVVRNVQRTGYEDTWTDVRRANASFLTQSGRLTGLHDLRRGIVVEAQPFVTATANGARDDATGDFAREDIEPSAGLNLRLGLTNLSLDATLNPDFSQVESDEGLVTVNERFDLFIEERRPFFLEGIELFATPNQLVYTRRIVDPIAGAKVTGKFGRLGVAHLTAVDDLGDDGVPGAPSTALFNVTRLRRDLGTNSIAGVTFTDREAGDSYNRVAAADAHIVFGRLYFFEGQLGGSWTRDAAGTRSAPLWHAEFDRTGRGWGFNYSLDGFGEGFTASAGFVPRSGIVSGRAFNRLTWYGARGAFLENFTVFFGPERLWRYDGFLRDEPIEGGEEISNSFRLRGGWEVSLDLNRDFVKFDPADYAGYEAGGAAFVPAAEATGLFSGSLGVESPQFRVFSGAAEIAYGEVPIFDEAAEGLETRLSAEVGVRAASSLRAAFQAVYSRITRRGGDEFARTVIPRLKLEYQPSRSLFFRVVSEYRAERRAALVDPATGAPIFVGGTAASAEELNTLRMDWLASYEPSPGTVAFLGYGSSMAEPKAFGLSRLSRTQDGFFLKLAYHFRR